MIHRRMVLLCPCCGSCRTGDLSPYPSPVGVGLGFNGVLPDFGISSRPVEQPEQNGDQRQSHPGSSAQEDCRAHPQDQHNGDEQTSHAPSVTHLDRASPSRPVGQPAMSHPAGTFRACPAFLYPTATGPCSPPSPTVSPCPRGWGTCLSAIRRSRAPGLIDGEPSAMRRPRVARSMSAGRRSARCRHRLRSGGGR
jgi:hypothetical protein